MVRFSSGEDGSGSREQNSLEKDRNRRVKTHQEGGAMAQKSASEMLLAWRERVADRRGQRQSSRDGEAGKLRVFCRLNALRMC